MKTKTCKKCGMEKSMTDFYIRVTRRDGYDSQCKQCRREYNRRQGKRNKSRHADAMHEIPSTKICSTCRRELEIEFFCKNSYSADGYRSQCQMCRRKYRRSYHLGKKYDLTPDEYNIILDKQGFVCAICGMEEISLGVDGKPRPLSVDHDHKTGIVRELLCQECNFKIGKIEMAAETESRMIEYLIRHKSDKLGKTLLSILPSILDRFAVT